MIIDEDVARLTKIIVRLYAKQSVKKIAKKVGCTPAIVKYVKNKKKYVA